MNLEEINKIVIECAYISFVLSLMDDSDEYYIDNQCNNCNYYIDITTNNKIILNYLKWESDGNFICINTSKWLSYNNELSVSKITTEYCEEFSTYYMHKRLAIHKSLINDMNL